MQDIRTGKYAGICDQFLANPEEWKIIYDSIDPQDED